MAYAFNDDKSKAEIAEIIEISGSAGSVPSGEIKMITINSEALSAYEIDDIQDYAVIDVIQQYYNSVEHTGHMLLPSVKVGVPTAVVNSVTNSLFIYVGNANTSAVTISYKVLLK